MIKFKGDSPLQAMTGPIYSTPSNTLYAGSVTGERFEHEDRNTISGNSLSGYNHRRRPFLPESRYYDTTGVDWKYITLGPDFPESNPHEEM